MKKFRNHLTLFFQRVMADDTDILEAASGFAGIGFVALMSDHDAHTYLTIPPMWPDIVFRISVLLGAGGQLVSVYRDDFRGRRAGAFGAMLFWTFVAAVLWNHQIVDAQYGKIGHPSAVASFIAFAVGNAMAYIKLGRP